MKKLLRKKYFVPLLVVAIMLIAAGGAYAWWTETTTIQNNIVDTANLAFNSGGQTPIDAANLVPQTPLTDDVNQSSNGYNTRFFYVTNTGDAPMHFNGWLANVNDPGIGDVVYVKITIGPRDWPWGDISGSLSYAGGPWLVYHGPVNALYGEGPGSALLTTTKAQPLDDGQSACYKVVTYLHGDLALDNSQDKTLTCDLVFKGEQVK